MAIVIKEIQVNTIVEKRVVLSTGIPNDVYHEMKQELKEDVLREVLKLLKTTFEEKKRER